MLTGALTKFHRPNVVVRLFDELHKTHKVILKKKKNISRSWIIHG